MRLCVECQYFTGLNFCVSPANGISSVDGKPVSMFASERRSAGKSLLFSDGKKCGPEALNFRKVEERITKPWWRFW